MGGSGKTYSVHLKIIIILIKSDLGFKLSYLKLLKAPHNHKAFQIINLLVVEVDRVILVLW